MTQQIPDKLKYKNELFDLCDTHLFPKELSAIIQAINTPREPMRQSFCSACWRRYVCEYLCENEQLFLETVRVMLAPEDCPIINGVIPSQGKSIFRSIYESLRLPIYSSCVLFIGKNRLTDWGWSPLTSNFKDVFRLEFENGRLTKETRLHNCEGEPIPQ